MPSSLTRVLSNALVFSTHLPVSVYGTSGHSVMPLELFAAPICLSFFTPKGSIPPARPLRLPSRRPSLAVARNDQRSGMRRLEASFQCTLRQVRNIDRNSIGYAFWPRLRVSPNLRLTNIAGETLGFRRTGFSPVLSLLMPAFSLVHAPPVLTLQLHCLHDALLPITTLVGSRSFGRRL